jgi:hypothetical protein
MKKYYSLGMSLVELLAVLAVSSAVAYSAMTVFSYFNDKSAGSPQIKLYNKTEIEDEFLLLNQILNRPEVCSTSLKDTTFPVDANLENLKLYPATGNIKIPSFVKIIPKNILPETISTGEFPSSESEIKVDIDTSGNQASQTQPVSVNSTDTSNVQSSSEITVNSQVIVGPIFMQKEKKIGTMVIKDIYLAEMKKVSLNHFIGSFVFELEDSKPPHGKKVKKIPRIFNFIENDKKQYEFSSCVTAFEKFEDISYSITSKFPSLRINLNPEGIYLSSSRGGIYMSVDGGETFYNRGDSTSNFSDTSYTLPVNSVEAYHVVKLHEENLPANTNYGLKRGDIVLSGKKISGSGVTDHLLSNVYYSTDAGRTYLPWRKDQPSATIDVNFDLTKINITQIKYFGGNLYLSAKDSADPAKGYLFQASLKKDSPYSPDGANHLTKVFHAHDNLNRLTFTKIDQLKTPAGHPNPLDSFGPINDFYFIGNSILMASDEGIFHRTYHVKIGQDNSSSRFNTILSGVQAFEIKNIQWMSQNYLFVRTSDGVYLLNEQDLSQSNKLMGLNAPFGKMTGIDVFTNKGVPYLAAVSDNGLFQSLDMGMTFTKRNLPFDGASSSPSTVGFYLGENLQVMLYLVERNTSGKNVLHISDDLGVTWSSKNLSQSGIGEMKFSRNPVRDEALAWRCRKIPSEKIEKICADSDGCRVIFKFGVENGGYDEVRNFEYLLYMEQTNDLKDNFKGVYGWSQGLAGFTAWILNYSRYHLAYPWYWAYLSNFEHSYCYDESNLRHKGIDGPYYDGESDKYSLNLMGHPSIQTDLEIYD